MKCPHCFVTFDAAWRISGIGADIDATWQVHFTKCSACDRLVIQLIGEGEGEREAWQVWPRGSVRPVAPEVPEPNAGDFKGACTVLSDSTNASAAISRRCLQSLLVNEGGAKKGGLVKQIEEVVESKQLRQQLADNLHYVTYPSQAEKQRFGKIC